VRAALCGERDAPDRWLACSVLAGLTSTNKIMKLTGFAVVEASSAAAAEAAKTSDLIRTSVHDHDSWSIHYYDYIYLEYIETKWKTKENHRRGATNSCC
jgi:hypothetical protein